VTKQMSKFVEPVEVRLKIIQNWETPKVWIDVSLDEPDLWSDVKPESYRVSWISNSEFHLFNRQPDKRPRYLGRLVDDLWIVNPAN
jgi:hypothetical protein